MRSQSQFWIAASALIATLLCLDPAFGQSVDLSQGQGFMVKPMRLETIAPAGQKIDVLLQIRNIAGVNPLAVTVRLVELSETLDGGWRLIEPGSSEDRSTLLSSRKWTQLSADQVTVRPLAPADVVAHVSIPASARGVYFAGVVVETPPSKSAAGVAVRVRFLVPLIVNIQGRPVRQQVALDDVLLTAKNDPGIPPTTVAALRIVNRGRTFSRVRGKLRIERQNNGVWRPVTTIDVAERGIIPGVTLELGDDLHRRLPAGTYRLHGELYVDGRRIAPLEKELKFSGNPGASQVAYDTALLLSPDVVSMDVSPGATRTTTVRVENPGDTPVTVNMAAATLRGLAGVEMGDIKGDDFSAAAWTEITPSQFTIAPGLWQNVRVISTVPIDGATLPNYYADLILDGTYADGQSAGETRSTVHLANRAGKPLTDGIVNQLQLAEGDKPSTFIVQMRFVNTGNVDVNPTARAFVLNAQGQSIGSVVLSGDEGPLLPLGQRTFSGELSLADVALGYYALHGEVTIAANNAVSAQRVLQIEAGAPDADGKATAPVVTVLDSATIDLPGKVNTPDDGSTGDAK